MALIPTSELFDSREESYETSTWLSMIDVMKHLGKNKERIKSKVTSGIGSHVMRVCTDLEEKPRTLLETFSNWRPRLDKTSQSHKPIFTNLQLLGFYDSDNTVHDGFVHAVNITNDEEWKNELLKRYHFGGQIRTAEELADHYKVQALENLEGMGNLQSTFESMKHDISFYVGLYDREPR